MKFAKWVGLVGTSLALLSSWSACAADLTPYPAAPPASYIPARYNWTGAYLGAAAGGGFGNANFFEPFGPASGSVSLNGFLFGGYAGLNYQINYVVLSAEGDFTGARANGSTTDSAGILFQTKVFWTASVTGRVGVAFDRVLLYGKAGVAFAYERDTISGTPIGVSPALGSAYPIGWTFGAGIDWAATDHWIARIEYDYLSFPNKAVSVSSPTIPLSPVPSNAVQVAIPFNEVKAGIAYKF
jgi:outer membrane immunogenic protein